MCKWNRTEYFISIISLRVEVSLFELSPEIEDQVEAERSATG
jgi:hypothetical protein